MEWKFFEGESPEFSTRDWHEGRESAHHLDEVTHVNRLLKASEFISKAVELGASSVVDLGCGDGGLLFLIKDQPYRSWGYDLMPTNVDHAVNFRGVDARYTDFKKDSDIEYGDVAVMTEVLEHLEFPHETIKNLPSKFLIASSPFIENNEVHYEFHLWAWDVDGYKKMIEDSGYKVIETALLEWSQVLLCVREDVE